MAAGRNTAFLRSVSEHQLLEPGQLDELTQHPLAQGDDLQALGRLLVQKRWLSKFQINLTAQGRAKDLILGPYRLLDRLGEGGMGQVFKAQHQVMNRLVALKIIRPEKLANATAVQRFFREVQAAAKLVHPNIVLAFDAGQVDKTYYFAMEYVEGADLARLVKESGRLPVATACDYVRQAALGLQHAYEKGLVHRDIKPSNLILARPGVPNERSSATVSQEPVVKILDMGLARLGGADAATGLTQDGAVIGTPDYIAPEQALDARSADIRSDLYSLGGTLYFLLAGRPPFQGGTLTEMLLKHQMEPPTPVTTLRPEVPPAVAGILDRLLAKRPDQRFQTPQELADALTAVSQGGGGHFATAAAFLARPQENDWADFTTDGQDQPVPRLAQSQADQTLMGSPRARTAGRADPAAKRQKLLWIGLGGAAALILAVVGLLVVLSGPGEKKPLAGTTEPQPPVIVQGPTPTPPVRPVPPDPQPRPPDPQPQPPDPQPQPPPMPAAPGGPAELWQIQASMTLTKLSISPDGKQAITTMATSSVAIWDLEKRELLRTFKSREIHAVAALPDPRTALIGQPSGAGLLDVQTAKVTRPLLGDMTSSTHALGTSADGKKAIVGGGTFTADIKDCCARLFDLETGQQLAKSDELPAYVRQVACSADGKRALLIAANRLFVWDTDKGAAVRQLTNVPAPLRDVAVTPDGQQALLGAGNNSLLWDVDGDRQVRSFGGSAVRVSISRDGKFGLLLCTVSRDPPLRPAQNLVLVELASGKTVRAVEGIESDLRDAAFMGSSTRALSISQDRTLRAWDLTPGDRPMAVENPPPPKKAPANGAQLWKLDVPLGSPARMAVSPDGKRLLVGLYDAALVVNTADGTVIGKLESKKSGPFLSMSFLPDGKRALILSDFRTVRLWDVDAAQILREDAPASTRLEALALAPDGRRYFVGGPDKFQLAIEVDTGKELFRMEGLRTPLRSLMVAPDGRSVLTSGDRDFIWWDAATGQQQTRGDFSASVRSVAISPDSRRLALGATDHTLRLWDRETAKELFQLRDLDTDASTVVWLPEGRRLLAGCGTSNLVNGKPVYRDLTVRLFDLHGSRLIGKFEGHDKHVGQVLVLPNGRHGISSSTDSTVRCWDLEAIIKATQ